MRTGGEIGENILVVNISSYTVLCVHLINLDCGLIPQPHSKPSMLNADQTQ